MKNNHKIFIALVSLAVGALVSSLAAAGVNNVSGTKHNFAAGGGSGVYQSTEINQVCIFCHTPHNAGKSQALWNKANLVSAPNYRLYTSSRTMAQTVQHASSFDPDSPSLLCLGCHDGKTAMNVLHSSSGTAYDAGANYPAGAKLIPTAQDLLGGPITMQWALPDMYGGTLPNMNLGGTATNPTQGDDLTNDHPLGFNYDTAQKEPGKSAVLYSVAQVGINSSNRIKFFGGPTRNKVECTTCHDPHVEATDSVNPELKPFLVMSNSGSALCLSCHNK